MYLIVGLGNIGDKYDSTRHNVGFEFIDFISKKYSIDTNRIEFKGNYGKGCINDKNVILLKPRTYMNLSGESIAKAADFFKIENKNIIVIHDDISLPLGKLRIRTKGSSGGHNGIKNTILNLASDEFTRIKIGVGSPQIGTIDYVLGKFSKDEYSHLKKVLQVADEAIEIMLKEDAYKAMNKFNGFIVEA